MPVRLRRRAWRAWAALGVSIILAACGTATPSASPPSTASPAPTSASQQPVSSADLAHAVVQIVAYLDGETQSAWWGSGTVIDPDGLILTNAHVVTPDDGELGRLEIGITRSTDAAPVPTFLAEVAATDWALDLAVLRITERIGGGSLPDDLAYVALGDSDDLEIGDAIRILGYPSIGGETITLTSGLVSGFVSEAGLGNRAWVKTDATIAGGNSGGLAANSLGELVAVPTIASAGADTDVVDCRPVRDTNRDGRIDDADDCVPLGGFLNGLRPVNLAVDMITAVQRGVAYEPIAPPPASVPPAAVEDLLWGDPTFSDGVTDEGAPVSEIEGLVTGTTEICAFWDFEGMKPGMRWSAEWSMDGELLPDVSFLDESWSLDESGSFWVCAQDESGFGAGVYDVALLVEDEFVSGGFVIVGDDLSTSWVTIRNESSDTICYVYASPAAATVWGPERIGESEVVGPGGEVTFQVISADYDVRGDDCDLRALFSEPLDLVGTGVVTLAWNGSGLERVEDDSASALRIGDCFTGDAGIDRSSTDIVPCGSPHEYEVVGILTYLASDSFPGDQALQQRAESECSAAFEDYVGVPFATSAFGMTQWSPTAETWASGDRVIVCALRDENHAPLTGSQLGAGR